MFLTDRMGLAVTARGLPASRDGTVTVNPQPLPLCESPGATSRPPAGHCRPCAKPSSARLGAIARGDLLFRRVMLGLRLDHGGENALVRRVEVRDRLPRLAVPLLDARLVR